MELLPQKTHVQVVADDTDFVLLVFFIWHSKATTQVSIRNHDRQVIDINKTALKLGDKSYNLLAVHALSGWDTVSYPYKRGKKSAVI